MKRKIITNSEKLNELDCIFITDLHGSISRYKKLFDLIRKDAPKCVFIGGDILPNLSRFQNGSEEYDDFIEDFLINEFIKLQSDLKENYPEIYIILGNDDPKIKEGKLLKGENIKLWHYVHDKIVKLDDFTIYGYSYVPPTPFQLKDWEKYDVSRFVDPGCISPEKGYRSEKIEKNIIRYGSIRKDLHKISRDINFRKSVFLFHSPPYKCNLDRAALDELFVDHVQLDVHVGSIAIREFIDEYQPHLTLHGHVHESTRLTGNWKQQFGKTISFSAAHDGNELAVVKFDLYDLSGAIREYI